MKFDKPDPIHVLLPNEAFFELLGTNKISVTKFYCSRKSFDYVASGSSSMSQEGIFDNYTMGLYNL